MRRNEYLLLIGLLFIGYSLKAQDSTSHVILKWAPLSLIDPCAAAIQMGVQIDGKDQLSFQQEFGYLVKTHKAWPEVTGFKLRSEFRFSRGMSIKRERNTNPSKPYFGFELFYSRKKYLEQDAYLYPAEDIDFEPETDYRYPIYITTEIGGLGIKLGWQREFPSNIVLDYYVGVSARFRSTIYVDAPYGIEVSHGYLFELHSTYEEDVVRPGLLLGVKVGYILK